MDHPASDAPPGKPSNSGTLWNRRGSNDGAPSRAILVGGTLVLGAVAVLLLIDVLSEAGGDAGFAHVAVEAVVVLLATSGLAGLWWAFLRGSSRHRRLSQELAAARAEAVRWRDEARVHLAGLGVAIDQQFERWALTPAEREVGLLLLKGLSLQEIADARGTSERTTRQQTLGIYRKSGLAGRAELSAFFLEDLLLPTSTPKG